MKVTGYQLREAVKRQTLVRDTAASMFTDSLRKFPDESKPSPDDMMEAFYKADVAIAKLQVAQMRYNLAIRVKGPFYQEITLAEAVKRLGGSGRCEKMWRGAATPPDRRHYSLDETRRIDEVRSHPALTLTEAATRSSEAAKGVGQLRQAIAVANATEIEIEDLDASLLE